MMKCNMGKVDRIIRSTVAIAIAVYAAMTFNAIVAVPVIVIAYTVATRWCILYHFMGINTGCQLQETNTVKKGRNNIIEGLSISLVFLLLLSILYLIVKYISI